MLMQGPNKSVEAEKNPEKYSLNVRGRVIAFQVTIVNFCQEHEKL